jgi:hypothetical protein
MLLYQRLVAVAVVCFVTIPKNKNKIKLEKDTKVGADKYVGTHHDPPFNIDSNNPDD